jgi:nitrate/nitrite transporter NarK
MARSFNIGAVDLNIGMTAYMLTLTVFIPISGWLADRFGSRSIFASAIIAFTLASVLCAASHRLNGSSHRASPWRLHYYLCKLAMDFCPQPTTRHLSSQPDADLDRKYSGQRDPYL